MSTHEDARRYYFTTFPAPARWSTQGRFEPWTWVEILHHLRTPELWPGAESIAASEDQLPGWTYARFADDCRVASEDSAVAERESAARVVEVYGLRVEYVDDPAIDPEHLAQWWGRWQYFAYTTAFHHRAIGEKPPGPRWRVLIPFARPVSLGDAVRIGHWAQSPHREAGMVDDVTLKPWLVPAVPAVVPGGYRWEVNRGALLDPDEAFTELDAWQLEDRTAAARRALLHTSVGEAGRRWLVGFVPTNEPEWVDSIPPGPLVNRGRLLPLLERASGPGWPRLGALAGSLWPGRVITVIGPQSVSRTAFALQLTEATARLGGPVLYAPTVLGPDEVVARLLTLRASGHVDHQQVLARQVPPHDAEDAVTHLARELPHLHLWARPRQDRTPESLAAAAVAMSQGHGGRPPVIVIDALPLPADGPAWWETVTDIARPGGLSASWPGAAVVVICPLPRGANAAFASRDALLAWSRHAATRATALLELDPDVADLADRSGLVVGLTVDPTSSDEAHPAAIAVLANRHGEPGALPYRFHPRAGRWEEDGNEAPGETARLPPLLTLAAP